MRKLLFLVLTIIFTLVFRIQAFAVQEYTEIHDGDTVAVNFEQNHEYYLKFTPQEDGVYLITSDDIGDCRPYLHVYDKMYVGEKMDPITWAEEKEDGNFYLYLNAKAGQTYYLIAGAFENRGTYSVKMEKSPITSVSITTSSNLVLNEYTNGSYQTDNGERYWVYDDISTLIDEVIYSEGTELTVSYNDGSTKVFGYDEEQEFCLVNTDDPEDIIDSSEIQFLEIESQNRKHWQLGEDNELIVSYAGLETSIPVEIIESDVQHGTEDNIEWYLSGEKNDLTLTICGTGDMPAYIYEQAEDEEIIDLDDFKESLGSIGILIGLDDDSTVKHIVYESGITSISRIECGNEVVDVSIPDTVTKIEDFAFADYENLEAVSIPENVSEIGAYAFLGCTKVTDLNIPNSMKTIGVQAFAYCSGLVSISFPESIEKLGPAALYECHMLKNVSLPGDLKTIPVLTFYNCSSLTEIDLPNSVTSIDGNAFSHTSLNSIEIPQGAATIGNSAFFECRNLESVSIPNSVTTIGSSAFSHCEKLESVVIPNNVVAIEESTFANCSALKNVTIPEGVTTIRDRAFYFCSSLSHIEIPSSVKTLGEFTFSTCSNLLNVEMANNGVESIGFRCFIYCEKLKSVTFPNTLKTISEGAFDGCKALEEVVLPEGLTQISYDAFLDCSGLKKLSLPQTLEELEYTAFNGCDNITELVLPQYVMNNQFAASTIHDLIHETGQQGIHITLQDNVTDTKGFFVGSDKITKLTLSENVKNVGGFTNCSALKDIQLNEHLKTILSDAFNGCKSMESIDIPESVTTIGERAFEACEKLNSIVLPDGITSIGAGAFSQCYDLQSINIPENVHELSDSMFKGSGIESLEIPTHVTSLGNNIFNGCSKLVRLVIPEEVTYIGTYALSNCSALKDIFYGGDADSWAELTRGKFSLNQDCKVHYGRDGTLKDISKAECSLTQEGYLYTGEVVLPVISSITYNNKELKEGTDYTIYSESKEIGDATATVTGIGDYTGTLTLYYKIVSENDISQASVTILLKKCEYTGEEIKPYLNSIYIGAKDLIEGTDYTVSYEDNIEIGCGSIIIKGTGEYSGELIIPFSIVPERPEFENAEETFKDGKAYHMILSWKPLKYINDSKEGYQIRYCYNSEDLNDAKIQTCYANDANGEKTFSVPEDLSEAQIMRAQIRAFKETTDGVVEGEWSDEYRFTLHECYFKLGIDNNSFKHTMEDFGRIGREGYTAYSENSVGNTYPMSQELRGRLYDLLPSVPEKMEECVNSLETVKWTGSCHGLSTCLSIARRNHMSNMKNYQFSDGPYNFYHLLKPAINTELRDRINYYHVMQRNNTGKSSSITYSNKASWLTKSYNKTDAILNWNEFWEGFYNDLNQGVQEETPLLLGLGKAKSSWGHTILACVIDQESNENYNIITCYDPNKIDRFIYLFVSKNSEFEFYFSLKKTEIIPDDYYPTMDDWLRFSSWNVPKIDTIDKSLTGILAEHESLSIDEVKVYTTYDQNFKMTTPDGSYLIKNSNDFDGDLWLNGVNYVNGESESDNQEIIISLPYVDELEFSELNGHNSISCVFPDHFIRVNTEGVSQFKFNCNQGMIINSENGNIHAIVSFINSNNYAVIDGKINGDRVEINYVDDSIVVNSDGKLTNFKIKVENYNGESINEITSEEAVSSVIISPDKPDNCTHSFGEWIIVKKASATEEGQKKRTCSLCGYEETETIKKTSSQTTEKPKPVDETSSQTYKINAANFPDSIFRKYVKSQFDKNKDGSLSQTEIKKAKKIDVRGLKIHDLKGIEIFKYVTSLDCVNTHIYELNISKNRELQYLYCFDNNLDKLDISKNSKLIKLDCWECAIRTLDVSNNPLLLRCCMSGRVYYSSSFVDFSKGKASLIVDTYTRIKPAPTKRINPIRIKKKAVTIKYAEIRKKSQTFKINKYVKTPKAQGKITFVKLSGTKKIYINRKTKKLIIKKGLKRGKYKITLKVKAAGNKYFKSKSKVVTLQIRVK